MSRKLSKRKRCLAFEALEERRMFAIDFAALAAGLSSKLTNLDNAMGGIDDPNNRLPVINQPLRNIPEMRDVFKTFSQQLTGALSGLSSPTESDVQQAIFNALGNPGLKILGDRNGNSASDAGDVTINTFDPDNGNIEVQLDLAKHYVGAAPFDFSLGIENLPLDFDAAGSVSVGVDFAYKDFTFGATNNVAYFKATTANELQFGINASLSGGLDGTIGFLKFTAEDGGDPATPELQLTLSANVQDNATLQASSVKLGGAADATLRLSALFGASPSAAPALHTNLHLLWQFDQVNPAGNYSSFGSAPHIAFEQVSMSLGSVLTDVVQPVVEVIQKVTKPVQPLFDALQAPIPVLSDLYHLITDPDEDISIMDIAELAITTGVIPEGYSELAQLSVFLVQLNTLINNVQTSPDASNMLVNFGDYSLEDIANKDLRDLSALAGDATDLAISDLQQDFHLDQFNSNFDFDGLIDSIDSLGIPGLGGALEDLARKASNGFHYSFPLIDDPSTGVLSLLLGSDTDLFNFNASFYEPNLTANGLVGLTLPIGLDFHLDANLSLDATFEAGYDTRGLRQMLIDPSHSPAKLLEGFYMSPQTHFIIGGGIVAVAEYDSAFFDAGLSGGISANVNILTNPAADTDGDQKVRFYNEMGNTLFTASGSIDLALTAFVRIGVEIAGEFIGVEEDFTISSTTLVDFNIGEIKNPFLPPDQLLLANDAGTASLVDPNDPDRDLWVVTDPNGVLVLNVGARASGRGHEPALTKENFVVFPGQLPPGVDPANLPAGDVVTVTAFGFTQTFVGVKRIVADGGDDNDTLIVKEGITVPVELYGGAGNDRLVSESTGASYLFGGDGDDSLTVTEANATLLGGNNNDQLFGGHGTNVMNGGFGDDLMMGGEGKNYMDGDRGADRMVAGPQGDVLAGGGEDDEITSGAGNDTVTGGRGNDHIVWAYGNGAPRIDGGAGIDSVGMTGSSTDDTFTLGRDQLGGYEIAIVAPGIGPSGIAVTYLKEIEAIDIEGKDGTDNFTVNEVTNTSVHDISINVGDVVNLDDAVDHVIVNGTQSADMMLVQWESALLKYHQKLFGGITQITGLPTYDVHVANVADDLKVRSLGGNDSLTVASITGPTLAEGGNDNDQMNVTALLPNGYPLALNVDGGAGHNAFNFTTGGILTADVIVTDSVITGNFIPAGANYYATGGDYNLGVNVSTGGMQDTVLVRNTLAGTTTTVFTNSGDDMVTVSSDGTASGNLSQIRTKLVVNTGAGANNVLKLIDSGASSGNGNVVIDSQQVSGFAGAADDVAVAYLSTGGSMTVDLRSSDNAAVAEKFRAASPNASLRIESFAGNEVFDIRSLTMPAQIVAGAGDDTINIGSAANRMDGVVGAISIDGGAGNDKVNMNDQGAIAGAGFSMTANSVTRSGSGMITHGAAEKIAINAGSLSDTFVVGAIQTTAMDISGGPSKDTLIGPNVVNDFRVTGAEKGTLNTNVTFTAIEGLVGGTQKDSFKILPGASLSGNLIGDAGTNTLDYSAFDKAVLVNLPSAQAAAVLGSVFNVQNVIGSKFDDVMLGDANQNSLVGGAGNDAMIGNEGIDFIDGGLDRDLMVGGFGADNLMGGSGDDIVISGTTAHDANLASLDLIMQEWRRTDIGAALRISHLRNGGAGALNGAVRLNNVSVHNDTNIDVLRGDAGSDWFWAKTAGVFADALLDFAAGDVVN